MTVEKYGTKDRPAYCLPSGSCYSGVGKVNIVMTPLGGFGWMLGEDVLDKEITERVEARTSNRLLVDTVRSVLNPIRGGANILHGKRPWYRPRDDRALGFLSGPTIAASALSVTALGTSEIPKQAPSHGDVFFGYTHVGVSHCEVPALGAGLACDPLSAQASNINGWNVAVEKKYLRYFGVVADLGGLYGGARQSDYLFGIRGGSSIGRFGPFAEVLFGAVHAPEFGSAPSGPVTSFAEDLGVGVDLKMIRLLSWRVQFDELKTGLPNYERYNVRACSGLGVRF